MSLTKDEALERAFAIWGDAVRGIERDGSSWRIDIARQASWHYLDGNGHVACHHDTCRLAEKRLHVPR